MRFNKPGAGKSAGGSLDRRRFIMAGAAGVTGLAVAGASGTAMARGAAVQAAPNGHSRREADYVAANRNQLKEALDKAGHGDLIWVPNDARIDLSGESGLSMAAGVTLAGGRRANGNPGGLLYTNEYKSALFKIRGDGVRITGLRIRGPREEYFNPSDADPYAAQGIFMFGKNSEVDNCELYGWPHAAVSLGEKDHPVRSHVHHCSIHNNAMESLGYGVNLYNGESLIEHNYFDMNRHSICGFGYPTNGYEARYNLVGPNPVSHAFDMHGLNENIDGADNVAGGTIFIHHNTFQFTHDIKDHGQEAITIRGVPKDRVDIEKNWFYHDTKPDSENVDANGQAYRQTNRSADGRKNIYASGNHFGRDEPDPGIGHPR